MVSWRISSPRLRGECVERVTEVAKLVECVSGLTTGDDPSFGMPAHCVRHTEGMLRGKLGLLKYGCEATEGP